MKDNLRSIGHAGEAGRGNKGESPSAAARSLASGTKSTPAKKATPVKKATPAKKAAPAKKPVAKKPTAAKTAAAPTTTDVTETNEPIKKAPAAKKTIAQKTASTSRPRKQSHLRAVPDAHDESHESASADASADGKKTEETIGSFSAEDLTSGFIGAAKRMFGADWEAQLAAIVAALRKRLSGDYSVDEFGFDPHVLDLLNALVEPVAEKWFRLEVRGVENIPTDGGALLVGNHSGTVPVDGLITGYAVRKFTGRPMRALGADLVFTLPVVGEIARKMGHTLACAEDAERLLTSGELAAVWPEGFKGVGKSFSERYKLQRFGRGGFVSSAMRAGVPIVPVSIVGAEEIYPLVGNIPSLARLLGIPYIPITPFFPWLGLLGLIPLPSKWIIEFGEPIRTDAYPPEAADDPMLLFNVTDQVREMIQQNLYELLSDRGNPFI